MIPTLWQHARYALRLMARNPGFTAAAVLMIALGIGANSAMFSLVDAVLLRPLPFGEPERLVSVFEARRAETLHVSGHEFVSWRDRSRTFEGLAIYGYRGVNLTGAGEATLVQAAEASANVFDVLRLEPSLGRGFAAGEDGSPAARVVVLSDRLWRARFGAVADVIGRTVRLDDAPFTVVGVMSARSELDPDLWIPFDVPADAQKVGKHSSLVIGRLAPGVTRAQAEADLDRIAVDLERVYPGFNDGHRVRVVSLADDILGSARLPLFVLLGAVAFILLLACVNVTHLLLARASARRTEVAIRAALGASRRRIVAELVTESVMLSLVGGVLGLVLAFWLVDLLPTIDALALPRLSETRVDGRVLAATLALTIVTGIASGLIPALRSARGVAASSPSDRLRTPRATARIGGIFMVSQVALALVLLVGAGLMLRSFARLAAVDPGFAPQGALAIELTLPPARFARPDQQANAIAELLARVERVPGVASAGTTTSLPLALCCDVHPIAIEHAPPPAPGEEQGVPLSIVGGDFFETMGIALRAGRAFTPADARSALPLLRYFEQQPYPERYGDAQPLPVAVINESMARRYWPDTHPVGRRFRILFSPWITVVGVVGDVRQASLSAAAEPHMYLPASQEPRGTLTLVARAQDDDPRALAGAVQREIRAFDPRIPVARVAAVDDILSASIGEPRFYATLLVAFAALALLLAAIGIYGVIAYAVEQRTLEIGIRWALGARPRDVLRLVLGRALRNALLGIALGVAGALALTRFLAALLFEIRRDDPATFLTVATGVLLVTLLAGYAPTRRALRVDPARSLRD